MAGKAPRLACRPLGDRLRSRCSPTAFFGTTLSGAAGRASDEALLSQSPIIANANHCAAVCGRSAAKYGLGDPSHDGRDVRALGQRGRCEGEHSPTPCLEPLVIPHPVEGATSDYVFTTESGTTVEPQNILRAVKAAASAAALTGVAVHTLRHSAATTWLENGVHLKAVSELLGHASIAITADIYGHLSEETARGAMATLSTRSGCIGALLSTQ